jgi:UDP-N-acetyl-D-mannosaminuronate dehydrogenase
MKPELNKVLKDTDIVMIAMDHDAYKKLTLEKIGEQTNKETIVCDIWNIFCTGKVFNKLKKPSAEELLERVEESAEEN